VNPNDVKIYTRF